MTSAPTSTQKQLLRHVQNSAKRCTDMLAEQRTQLESVDIAPQSWYATFQLLQDHGRILRALGREAGVPARWIDHAQAKGERGIGWCDDHQRWPEAEPVDRARVVSRLSERVHTLQMLLVVYAVCRHHDASGGLGADHRVRHWISLEWEVIGGLAALAGLDIAERDRVWPADTAWAYEITTDMHRWDTPTLSTWLREFQCRPENSTGLQQVELMQLLDIPRFSDRAALPPPAKLIVAADIAVRSAGYPAERLNETSTATNQLAGPGAGIGEATTVALPLHHPPPVAASDATSSSAGPFTCCNAWSEPAEP